MHHIISYSQPCTQGLLLLYFAFGFAVLILFLGECKKKKTNSGHITPKPKFKHFILKIRQKYDFKKAYLINNYLLRNCQNNKAIFSEILMQKSLLKKSINQLKNIHIKL